MTTLLLGIDVGSSSVKVALLDAADGTVLQSAMSPKQELPIIAHQSGWAEQDPQTWWQHFSAALSEIQEKMGARLKEVAAIGISYQMHGLVLLDKDQHVLRPSIIWCDSRAVSVGERAFDALGKDHCLREFLNSPGNFTAAKLAWVKEHEPEIFAKARYAMLPGDYIALRLTGEPRTTVSGLSEGIFWNFKHERVADELLQYFGISAEILPEFGPSFGPQGIVKSEIAEQLGLGKNVAVTYRAGDQPNNALSLNVLHPGEVAATAGTSGVVYGVSDAARFDPLSRVNTFAHVNHRKDAPRYGVLLCINGTGILNSWLRKQMLAGAHYDQMNALAAKTPPGARGLYFLPYGNGAERSLGNRNLGASLHNLQLTIHEKEHVLRAAQEGIVYSLQYGLEIMKGVGVEAKTVRAGHANLFLSPLFREAFTAVTGATLELYQTDGAQGAARGAGLGAKIFKDENETFKGLRLIAKEVPNRERASLYQEAFAGWKKLLPAC